MTRFSHIKRYAVQLVEKMVDAHCHINDKAYNEDQVAMLIEEAKNCQVEHLICAGFGLVSSKRAVRLSQKFPSVWAVVGLGYEGKHKNLGRLKRELIALTANPKVVGIGECGLDYRTGIELKEQQEQKKLLKLHFEVAGEIKLPVVVHCRSAFGEIYEMARTTGVVGQMHCFTGTTEWMKKFANLGWYISFGGLISFRKNGELREVVKQTPIELLLLETDSPHLTPEPVRGSVNRPANVKILAKLVAGLKGLAVEEVEAITTKNLKRLFAKIV